MYKKLYQYNETKQYDDIIRKAIDCHQEGSHCSEGHHTREKGRLKLKYITFSCVERKLNIVHHINFNSITLKQSQAPCRGKKIKILVYTKPNHKRKLIFHSFIH